MKFFSPWVKAWVKNFHPKINKFLGINFLSLKNLMRVKDLRVGDSTWVKIWCGWRFVFGWKVPKTLFWKDINQLFTRIVFHPVSISSPTSNLHPNTILICIEHLNFLVNSISKKFIKFLKFFLPIFIKGFPKNYRFLVFHN